jgi:hypothetical protein
MASRWARVMLTTQFLQDRVGGRRSTVRRTVDLVPIQPDGPDGVSLGSEHPFQVASDPGRKPGLPG